MNEKELKETLELLRERDNRLRDEIIGMQWEIQKLKWALRDLKQEKEMAK
jgi:prefoldin subunit 5